MYRFKNQLHMIFTLVFNIPKKWVLLSTNGLQGVFGVLYCHQIYLHPAVDSAHLPTPMMDASWALFEDVEKAKITVNIYKTKPRCVTFEEWEVDDWDRGVGREIPKPVLNVGGKHVFKRCLIHPVYNVQVTAYLDVDSKQKSDARKAKEEAMSFAREVNNSYSGSARDVPAFKEILEELQRDPDDMEQLSEKMTRYGLEFGGRRSGGGFGLGGLLLVPRKKSRKGDEEYLVGAYIAAMGPNTITISFSDAKNDEIQLYKLPYGLQVASTMVTVLAGIEIVIHTITFLVLIVGVTQDKVAGISFNTKIRDQRIRNATMIRNSHDRAKGKEIAGSDIDQSVNTGAVDMERGDQTSSGNKTESAKLSIIVSYITATIVTIGYIVLRSIIIPMLLYNVILPTDWRFDLPHVWLQIDLYVVGGIYVSFILAQTFVNLSRMVRQGKHRCEIPAAPLKNVTTHQQQPDSKKPSASDVKSDVPVLDTTKNVAKTVILIVPVHQESSHTIMSTVTSVCTSKYQQSPIHLILAFDNPSELSETYTSTLRGLLETGFTPMSTTSDSDKIRNADNHAQHKDDGVVGFIGGKHLTFGDLTTSLYRFSHRGKRGTQASAFQFVECLYGQTLQRVEVMSPPPLCSSPSTATNEPYRNLNTQSSQDTLSNAPATRRDGSDTITASTKQKEKAEQLEFLKHATEVDDVIEQTTTTGPWTRNQDNDPLIMFVDAGIQFGNDTIDTMARVLSGCVGCGTSSGTSCGSKDCQQPKVAVTGMIFGHGTDSQDAHWFGRWNIWRVLQDIEDVNVQVIERALETAAGGITCLTGKLVMLRLSTLRGVSGQYFERPMFLDDNSVPLMDYLRRFLGEDALLTQLLLESSDTKYGGVTVLDGFEQGGCFQGVRFEPDFDMEKKVFRNPCERSFFNLLDDTVAKDWRELTDGTRGRDVNDAEMEEQIETRSSIDAPSNLESDGTYLDTTGRRVRFLSVSSTNTNEVPAPSINSTVTLTPTSSDFHPEPSKTPPPSISLFRLWNILTGDTNSKSSSPSSSLPLPPPPAKGILKGESAYGPDDIHFTSLDRSNTISSQKDSLDDDDDEQPLYTLKTTMNLAQGISAYQTASENRELERGLSDDKRLSSSTYGSLRSYKTAEVASASTSHVESTLTAKSDHDPDWWNDFLQGRTENLFPKVSPNISTPYFPVTSSTNNNNNTTQDPTTTTTTTTATTTESETLDLENQKMTRRRSVQRMSLPKRSSQLSFEGFKLEDFESEEQVFKKEDNNIPNVADVKEEEVEGGGDDDHDEFVSI
ncbi:hypothetical protein HDU76_001050 [Blyttiomyces sp. JEL0837]|nr:hypothetical protein HDU76_001050 [Blyttiomyces sp. JEL0837]